MIKQHIIGNKKERHDNVNRLNRLNCESAATAYLDIGQPQH